MTETIQTQIIKVVDLLEELGERLEALARIDVEVDLLIFSDDGTATQHRVTGEIQAEFRQVVKLWPTEKAELGTKEAEL